MSCEASIKSSKLGAELKSAILESNLSSKKQNEGCCSHNKTAGQKQKERKEGLNYAVQHSLVMKRIVSIIKRGW